METARLHLYLLSQPHAEVNYTLTHPKYLLLSGEIFIVNIYSELELYENNPLFLFIIK